MMTPQELAKQIESGELTVTGRTSKTDQERAAELLRESSSVPRSERAKPIANPKFPSFPGLEAAMARLANPSPEAQKVLEQLGIKAAELLTEAKEMQQ